MQLQVVEIDDGSPLMGAVAELYAEIFREVPWNEHDLTLEKVMMIMSEHFKRPGLVARAVLNSEGQPVGFCWLFELFQNELKLDSHPSARLAYLFRKGKKVAYVKEAGVKIGFRRSGVGERVVQEVLAKARENGANFAMLSTHKEAHAAKALFEKVGFQNSGIVRPPEELGRTYWLLRF